VISVPLLTIECQFNLWFLGVCLCAGYGLTGRAAPGLGRPGPARVSGRRGRSGLRGQGPPRSGRRREVGAAQRLALDDLAGEPEPAESGDWLLGAPAADAQLHQLAALIPETAVSSTMAAVRTMPTTATACDPDTARQAAGAARLHVTVIWADSLAGEPT